MKLFCLFLLLGTQLQLLAQASPTQNVANINLSSTQFAIVNVNPLQAINQYRAWNSLLNKDSSNANAWLQTYIWLERDPITPTKEKKIQLNQLVTGAGDHIAGDAAFLLMQFLHSGRTDSAALKIAYEKSENKTILYPYWIQYHIRVKRTEQAQADCIAFDQIQPMPKAIFQYHFNVLQSAGKNAVVYARGLNDLVPMCILQLVYGIRTDITLRYYEDGQTLSEKDYLCLTLGKTIIQQYPKTSYTGLLVKNTAANGFDELKNNMEQWIQQKKLPYQTDDAELADPQIAALQKNYLPALLLLLPYYEKINDPKQYTVKKIINEIYKHTVPEKLNELKGNSRKMDSKE